MSEPALQFIGYQSFSTPNADAKADVVFVHGLGGDLSTTWSISGDPTDYWPSWLATDLGSVNVWAAGYDSGVFLSLATGAGPTIRDTATTVLDLLATRGFGNRSLVFITHSLGGIIIKQVLRLCSDSDVEEYRSILDATKGIIFLATPHYGAKLAGTISAILSKFTSSKVDGLSQGQDMLIDLGEWFRNWAFQNSISIASFYEVQKTSGLTVVDKLTANPNVQGCTHVAVHTDHVGICKPSSRDSQVYTSTLAFLAKILESYCTTSCIVSRHAHATMLLPGEHMQLVPLTPNQTLQDADLFSGIVTNDSVSRPTTELALPQTTGRLPSELQTDYEYYTTMAPDDRRTLAQKLTVAGRSYEVRMAEQKKERFAMALHRHIAQASSLSQFTHLLSNIESRFNRIIYPMIVDGTSTDIINRRIQEDVVDAFVSTTPADATDTTSLLVEGALYYLTGNCHVRWDNSET